MESYYVLRLTSDDRTVLRGPGTDEECRALLADVERGATRASTRLGGSVASGRVIESGQPHTEAGRDSWAEWTLVGQREARRLLKQGVRLVPLLVQRPHGQPR